MSQLFSNHIKFHIYIESITLFSIATKLQKRNKTHVKSII